jgi:hypothetical protein
LSLLPSVYRQHLTVDEPCQVGGKNTTALAMSCALPKRFIAIRSTSAFFPSSPHLAHCGCRIGADETRRDAVDGDAERAKLMGELPGEADHRVFRRNVVVKLGACRLSAGVTPHPAVHRGDPERCLSPIQRPSSGPRWGGSSRP